MVIATQYPNHVTANCDVCDVSLVAERGVARYDNPAQVARVATRRGWTATPDASTLICKKKNDAHNNARTLLATKTCPTCGHNQQEQQ